VSVRPSTQNSPHVPSQTLQLKSNIPATLLANEWRVRLRPRLRLKKSELCKSQCSRRAIQIRTSVRASCKARVRARDAAGKRVTRSVERLRLRPNKSELCKAQCSRRAMQIRAPVRAYFKAGLDEQFYTSPVDRGISAAAPLLISDSGVITGGSKWGDGAISHFFRPPPRIWGDWI
jgi:hypothetical protein